MGLQTGIDDPARQAEHAAARDRARRRLAGRTALVQYGVAALFLAVSLPLAFLLESDRSWSWPLAVGLVLAHAAASRIPFEVGSVYTVPTQIAFVPMLFLVPVGWVPLLVSAGYLLGRMPRYVRGVTHPSRAVFALSDAWYAIGPVLVLVVLGADGSVDWSNWPVYLLALGAQFAVDFGAAAASEIASRGVSLPSFSREEADIYVVDALLAPLGLLAAFAAQDEPAAFLLAMPMAGILWTFSRERTERIDHALELSQAYRGTAMLLGEVIEGDDAYTGEHTRGVVMLASLVADELGVDEKTKRLVELGAMLHDVGKLSIPKEVIRKPGPLNDVEWALIRTHTIEGQRMLNRVGGVLSEVGRIVRSSHERWDGTGYPDGLAGEDIPLAARIVSCCDAYNAMTTDRSYRKALPVSMALEELRQSAGMQFDPQVVDAVLAIVRTWEPELDDGPVDSDVDEAIRQLLSGADGERD